MYNAYYGFKERPFNQTPDSSYFFPSEKHKSALDALVYAIGERKGFVVITGEIGSGKTTVVRTLMRRLGPNVRTAFVTNTYLTPKGVIVMVLEDLGIAYEPGTKERLIVQLNEYLIEQARHNQEVVILIDESQNLSMQCLEEIRMLSNLETEKEKLIQIVLVGQPELRKKLDSVRLEQLRQRISVQFHLQPLNQEETRHYILHRLEVAKSNGQDMNALFEAPAFEIVYQYSRGLPRLINKLCDHALLTGYVADSRVITPAIVEESVRELQFREEKNHEQIYQSA